MYCGASKEITEKNEKEGKVVAGTLPQDITFLSFQYLHFEVECCQPAALHVVRHSPYTRAMHYTTTTKCKLLKKQKLLILVSVGASHLLGLSKGPLPADIHPTPKFPLGAATLSTAHRHFGRSLAWQAGTVRQAWLRRCPRAGEG